MNGTAAVVDPVLAEAAKTAKAQVAKGRRYVHTMVFPENVQKADSPEGASKSLPEASFQSVIDRTLTPPYDANALVYISETNGDLTSAIDAYVANVDSFGHRFVLADYAPKERVSRRGEAFEKPDLPEAVTAAIKEEALALQNLFLSLCPDGFLKLRKDARQDREQTGYAYWEVIRDRKGRLSELRHIPAVQMRLSPEQSDLVPVNEPYVQAAPDGQVVIETKKRWRRFRLFVQAARFAAATGTGSIAYSSEIRWFKEYGDPRVVDNQTGTIYSGPDDPKVLSFGATNTPMPEERRASEIVFFRRYWPRTPYGVPRWIGALLSAVGARAADEVNFVTLKNNNIPSMMLLVSNGRLTEATIDRIKEFVETHIQGSANFSQFMILEGEGEYTGDETNRVKIEAKPLADVQHTDALFVNYMALCGKRLWRAMRLPPLFGGDQEGANRSVSEVLRRLTDEQVFAPERSEFDEFMSRFLLREVGMKYHRFESKTPNVTDNRDLISMLAVAEKTGGLTPTLARALMGDIFPGVQGALEYDGSKFDPDIPFSLSLALALKALGAPPTPGQTTAVVAPGVEVPGAQGPSGPLAKEFSAMTIQELLNMGNRASAELAALLARGDED